VKISSEDGSRSGCLGGCLLTTIVIVIAVLVTGVLVARTDGARSFVEKWLSERLGTEVTVERSRIGPPYTLMLDGVSSRGYNAGDKPGFAADKVHLGLGLRPLLRVFVEGCRLTLRDEGDGVWHPAVFASLGALPDRSVPEISRVTAGFRKRVALDVEHAALTWLGPDGVPRHVIAGVDFSVAPAAIPGRDMYYHRLVVRGWRRTGGSKMPPTECEWLASEQQRYVELHRSEDFAPARGGSAPGADGGTPE
jgi:hypothetical protein